MPDQQLTSREFLLLRGEHYHFPRKLADGRVLAMRHMIATAALFVLLSDRFEPCGYAIGCRYCYETAKDALAALMTWDGAGDPPGPWIKQKPPDRLNPALAREDFGR